MFVDEVEIKLIAGKGGDGCMSFRREKYVDMGGPDGGSGGRGSNIIFTADKNLKTLIDLRMMKTVKGLKGSNGKGKNMQGAIAEDVIVKVPMGTTIFDIDTGLVIEDLVNDGQSVIVAYGGRGGKGNKAFATHANPAPQISEYGEPGEERIVKCELKVLADVGLVGMPSVGKSSILSMISASKPKIGAYHFTTLSPNLGVVKYNDFAFTIADLPGLIEGSSSGAGLGDRFLRHAMRTKVIAHVIDMGSFEGRNPIQDYEMIKKEIESYSNTFEKKKNVIIANKMDLELAKENIKKFKKKYPDLEIFEISAINNIGLDLMINGLAKLVIETDSAPIYDEEVMESHIVYKFKKEHPYTINKIDNVWEVSGDEVVKLFKMTKFNTEENIVRFARQLRKMGIEDELVRLGAKKGDSVQIMDYIFELKI